MMGQVALLVMLDEDEAPASGGARRGGGGFGSLGRFGALSRFGGGGRAVSSGVAPGPNDGWVSFEDGLPDAMPVVY